jgi:RNA polymerase sigma-70 factor (ECF subfamily)
MTDIESAAARAAERAARESYGRLLAYLAYRWRDIASAEDALAEAFASALATWPRDGVPASPDAWLMTAAKRNLLQAARHRRLTEDPAVTVLLGESEEEMIGPASYAFPAPRHGPHHAAPAIPDERLKLMFVCAHPAIAPEVHAALMLQTVLGLEAKQIAAAFLVAPATLAQRLVRAKAKIRDAGLRFEEPEEADLPARLHAVLDAIYAAYSLGWDGAAIDAESGQESAPELAGEALYLAQLARHLLPTDAPAGAEAAGLAALLLFCEARRDARSGPQGEFVPLHEQDTDLWDRDMIMQAEQLLRQAATLRAPGRFQLEAAIQSAHCQRAFIGSVPWEGIALLYTELARIAPTVGALVGQAVAAAEAHGTTEGTAEGLRLLARIDDAAIRDYQPFWVAKGYLLAQQGEKAAAHAAYMRAIGLTVLPGPRAYLLARAAELQ